MKSNAKVLDAITEKLEGYDPNALPVELAQQIMREAIEPVTAIESVAIRDSLDRTLAKDILSPINVPAHDNSAMDGYAMRGADLDKDGPSTFTLSGTSLAGQPFEGKLGPRACVRIMTGAVMPTGLDTVVPQELAEVTDNTVRVPPKQKTGQHRRHKGEDLTAGKPALRAGKLITPADIGLIASLGLAELPVYRPPRVAFFSSGNELRSIGETLEPGQVYDSNRYTIYGMLRRLGADVIDMGVIPDEPEALESAVRHASENADAIISSGGVSVGEADFTRDIMARLGDVRFWTIAMRPGRPMAFGKIGNAWYFGLPGNPVAVMVTFYFFARLGLNKLAGQNATSDPLVRAASTSPIRKRPGRTEYQRGLLEVAANGRSKVTITGSQGSGVLRSMSEANCMIVLHHEQGNIEDGEMVDCLPFDGLV